MVANCFPNHVNSNINEAKAGRNLTFLLNDKAKAEQALP